MPKKVKDGEGNLIDERRKNNNGYKLTWGAILLLATVMGWFFIAKGQSENRVTQVEKDYTIIKVQLAEISNDIKWIKETLNKREVERRR